MTATLPPDVRAYVVSQPDELLVSWLRLSPQAVDVLSERERSHALAILADTSPIYSDEYRTGQAAAYVRERLVRGDHVAAAARAAWDVGALITIDRKLYRVERHIGRGYRLRGPAGGILELTPPLREGEVWHGWIGGLAAASSRLATFRRQPDASFSRVVGEMGRPARKAARP